MDVQAGSGTCWSIKQAGNTLRSKQDELFSFVPKQMDGFSCGWIVTMYMELAAFWIRPTIARLGLTGEAWSMDEGNRRRLEVWVALMLHGSRTTWNDESDVEDFEIGEGSSR